MKYFIKSPVITISNDSKCLTFSFLTDFEPRKVPTNKRLVDNLEAIHTPRPEKELKEILGLKNFNLLLKNKILIDGSLGELSEFVPQLNKNKKKFKSALVCITGSLYSYMAPQIVLSLLNELVENVEVIIKKNAEEFVSLKWFTYMGVRVWSNETSSQNGIRCPHLFLAKNVDFILVAPATAHTISTLATANCGDLTSLTIAATNAPVILSPSMNSSMWQNKQIQKNIDECIKLGFRIIQPRIGISAAGHEIEYGISSVSGHNVCKIVNDLLLTN